MTSAATRIDSHQHFWQIDRGDYDWMTDEVASIRHDILPKDLKPYLEAHKISGTIAVQAAATVAETRFLLDLAAKNPLIKGVVGWVDVTAKDASETLQDLAQNPLFKGIRPMLQDIPETEWVLQPSVIETLRSVAKLGLKMDVLITPRHLDVIATLAQKIPDLQMVVDHCAKPTFDPAPTESWHAGMAQLATFDQISCKFSGLVTEIGPNWTPGQLDPVLDRLLSTFTPKRVMWGSDWPVLNLAGDYDRWVTTTQDMLAPLSEGDAADIWGNTASRFYDLEVKNDL
ncbi:MAG: amidohydrolase family protein [Thalassovita sp.]